MGVSKTGNYHVDLIMINLHLFTKVDPELLCQVLDSLLFEVNTA